MSRSLGWIPADDERGAGFDLENLKIVDLAGLDDNNAAREKSTMRYLDNAWSVPFLPSHAS